MYFHSLKNGKFLPALSIFYNFQPIAHKQINEANLWLKSSISGDLCELIWLWYVSDNKKRSWGMMRNGTRHDLIWTKTKQYIEGVKTHVCTYPDKAETTRLLPKVILLKHKAEEHLTAPCPFRKEVDQVGRTQEEKSTVLLRVGTEEVLGWYDEMNLPGVEVPCPNPGSLWHWRRGHPSKKRARRFLHMWASLLEQSWEGL